MVGWFPQKKYFLKIHVIVKQTDVHMRLHLSCGAKSVDEHGVPKMDAFEEQQQDNLLLEVMETVITL